MSKLNKKQKEKLIEEKRCGYCFKKTDGTLKSIDLRNGDELYFCSPLHSMMLFNEG